MATKSPDVFSQIFASVKSLAPAKIFALFVLLVATTAGIIYMVQWTSRPDFQILYSALTPEDAGEIINKLKENKISYQIGSNGKTIMVPERVLYETRLQLANEGLPQGSGVGFEIFDNTKLGMTEFVQNVNYQRAIQGELTRTINGFEEVESSRIHIVMPSKSLFINDEEPATASVVLKMRRGRRLSDDQVRAIVHLVSASVSQLEPDNVTIVDNYGNLLVGPKDGTTSAQLSSDQLEFQQKAEKSLEKSVGTMLEKVLGPDKAIVRIACTFDFRQHEKTEEIYNPNGKVVRSEQVRNTITAKADAPPVGIPGKATNVASGSTGEVDTGNEEDKRLPEYQKQDRTVNYEIGKVISRTVEPIGRLERISVAVVIDGTHELVTNDEGEEELKYIPRTEEERTKIEEIVKRAVNFDSERGDEIEVQNIPFETAKIGEEKVEVEEKSWVSRLEDYRGYFRYVFMAVFLLFSFMFIVRPLVRWLTTTQTTGSDMNRQLPMTIEEIERGYGEGRGSLPFRDRAVAMLAGQDESSLSVAREWLSEK